MGFALLVGMAPFGVLSSAVLVPVLPRLAAAGGPAQQLQVGAEVLTSLLCVVAPLSALIIELARPIIVLLLSGRAFGAAEVAAVAALLPWVVVGAAAGVVREVLVRCFYARSDARFPLIVSCGALGANAALDWASYTYGWGARGLVASTAATTLASCGIMWAGLLRGERAGGTTRRLLWDVATISALALGASGCAHLVLRQATLWLGPAATRPAAAAVCVTCTAAGVVAFCALLLCTRSPSLAQQRAAVRRLAGVRLQL